MGKGGAKLNAQDFRHLYEYHFTINRKIWEACVMPLSQEAFIQPIKYSVGSVRNQVVHMLNIEDRWFSGLRGEEVPGFLNPVHYHQREQIREIWDGVEAKMRDYLQNLHDDMLHSKPFGEDEGMILWQVLLHVANHGTDHRAQLLALLHQLGVKTMPQDYVFYIMGKM
jgi:uncharacterized damage-inducible protein DinB